MATHEVVLLKPHAVADTELGMLFSQLDRTRRSVDMLVERFGRAHALATALQSWRFFAEDVRKRRREAFFDAMSCQLRDAKRRCSWEGRARPWGGDAAAEGQQRLRGVLLLWRGAARLGRSCRAMGRTAAAAAADAHARVLACRVFAGWRRGAPSRRRSAPEAPAPHTRDRRCASTSALPVAEAAPQQPRQHGRNSGRPPPPVPPPTSCWRFGHADPARSQSPATAALRSLARHRGRHETATPVSRIDLLAEPAQAHEHASAASSDSDGNEPSGRAECAPGHGDVPGASVTEAPCAAEGASQPRCRAQAKRQRSEEDLSASTPVAALRAAARRQRCEEDLSAPGTPMASPPASTALEGRWPSPAAQTPSRSVFDRLSDRARYTGCARFGGPTIVDQDAGASLARWEGELRDASRKRGVKLGGSPAALPADATATFGTLAGSRGSLASP